MYVGYLLYTARVIPTHVGYYHYNYNYRRTIMERVNYQKYQTQHKLCTAQYSCQLRIIKQQLDRKISGNDIYHRDLLLDIVIINIYILIRYTRTSNRKYFDFDYRHLIFPIMVSVSISISVLNGLNF